MPLNCVLNCVIAETDCLCKQHDHFSYVNSLGIQRLLGAHEETNADVHTECPVSFGLQRDGLSEEPF